MVGVVPQDSILALEVLGVLKQGEVRSDLCARNFEAKEFNSIFSLDKRENEVSDKEFFFAEKSWASLNTRALFTHLGRHMRTSLGETKTKDELRSMVKRMPIARMRRFFSSDESLMELAQVAESNMPRIMVGSAEGAQCTMLVQPNVAAIVLLEYIECRTQQVLESLNW